MPLISVDDFNATSTPRSVGREPTAAVKIAQGLDIPEAFHFDNAWFDNNMADDKNAQLESHKDTHKGKPCEVWCVAIGKVVSRLNADSNKAGVRGGYRIRTKRTIDADQKPSGVMILKFVRAAEDTTEDEDEE